MSKSIVNKGKSLIKSKTFWFNILAGAVAAASLFGFSSFEPSVENAQVISTSVAIINILLRLMTDKPITSVK